VDLRTGALGGNDPDALITKGTDIEYDESASCPQFIEFLDQIFEGDQDLIGFVQRAIGYTLTGRNQEQCMFLMFGEGANGKSVLQNVIAALLGEFRVSAPPQMLVSKARSATNDIARLRGARLVTLSEESAGGRWDESLVKQLTGGDQISARELYKDFESFVVTAKMWMATNHLPRINGVDYAIWRRMKVIPFRYRVTEEEIDRDLQSKLLDELPGILNWATQGCRDWQANGLGSCPALDEATQGFRSGSDAIHLWLSRRTEKQSVAETKASVLYDDYREFAESIGEAITITRFGKELASHGYNKRKRSDGFYYQGLLLRTNGRVRRRRKKTK